MKQKFISALVLLLSPIFSYAADPHSYAQPERILVKHIDLALNVDAEKQTLDGTATLTFERKDKTANLILDSMGLKIESIQIQKSKKKWVDAKYTSGKIDEILGSKLEIELPPNTDVKVVRIKYAAAKDSAALNWNTALQTISKRPFLSTSGEPITTRAWIPCQDTPIVRTTYAAEIHVAQSDLMALMSTNNPTNVNPTGHYSFKMEIPVPSYLIAMAVGKLGFKSTGTRTGVYAEPEILERAATEFSDTEKMVAAAESLYGKYVWGRYDLLVLPASFTWGGMENPRLTFITPTLITGKKDLVDVVAHEIAHSWSGNLVTNAQWSDIWINEGFTTYVQYRIIEQLHGTPTRMRDMALDRKSLENDFKDKDSLKSEDTRLKTNFEGRNPDDAFSNVPYTKGALLLYAVEEKIGKPAFDAFLKKYFAKYTFKSITTDQVIEEFIPLVGKDFLMAWIAQPYLPLTAPALPSEIINHMDLLVKNFLEKGQVPAETEIQALTSKDRCYFLEAVLNKVKLDQIRKLDAAFHFSETKDPEVLTLWYTITLPKNYDPTLATVPAFLGSVGRGKFLVPVYEALLASKNGKKLATSIFEKNKTFYSPLMNSRLEKKFFKGKNKVAQN